MGKSSKIERLFVRRYPSPIGRLVVAGWGEVLVGLELDGPKVEAVLGRRVSMRHPELEIKESGEFNRAAVAWLDAYFSGETVALPEIDLIGSQFQIAVWTTLRDLPSGSLTSYGAIARAIGRPAASRAVGAAVGRNPVGIVIPCHRVVGRDGSLTGYGWGLERKIWLLEHEGISLPISPGQLNSWHEGRRGCPHSLQSSL